MLLQWEDLAPLLDLNRQFALISDRLVKRDTNGSAEVPVRASPTEVEDKNKLSFDSSRPLTEWIEQHFNPVRGRQFTSLRPEFLKIEYSVLEAGSGIKGLRILHFDAPEIRDINGVCTLGIQKATYNLCTVVKLKKGNGDDDNDDEGVRMYYRNGEEIPRAEIGRMEEEVAAAQQRQPWSIKEPGNYVLFYFRVSVSPLGMADEASEMNLDAAEYREQDE